MVRVRMHVPIAVSILALFLCSCSNDLPTSSAVTLSSSGATGQAAAILRPGAMSSIRVMPELGILDGGGVGSGTMYSTYFRTTATNRAFRRGFAEFSIPDFSAGFFGATAILRETRATVAFPLPADRHELSTYSDVDLVVDPGDFDRPTSPLGTFETDANEEMGTFAFDVSTLVSRSQGGRLGFRVKLEDDPAWTAEGFRGSAFEGSSTPAGATIEVLTTIPRAIDHLQASIQGMAAGECIPADVIATLLGHLQRAEDIVSDGNPNNDRSACPVLSKLIDDVDAALPEMCAPEWSFIRESAQNLRTGLGCTDGRLSRLPTQGRIPQQTPEQRGGGRG